ncbi:hypothetical protein F7R15_23125 [Pseudomonas reinekei]|uniref:Uncharacterized protein n=1 Tax=Pseudomonas reinekei TaxID=395598 RepID=A0A6H9R6Z0_PSERE|nr:hypothetical protein F7R15_23125 [Pseudomonas reinekei]
MGGFGLQNHHKHCRRWLASDGGGSVSTDADCQMAIAGKPAPTRVFQCLCGRFKPESKSRSFPSVAPAPAA